MQNSNTAQNSHTTDAWKLYELGRDYHNRLTPNQYRLVETNNEFYAGNQWLGLPETPAMRGALKPTFNILKRITNSFVATLTASDISVHVAPAPLPPGTFPTPDPNFTRRINNAPDPDFIRHVNNILTHLMKKLHFRYRLRDALFDAARTGDYCAHFWFDPFTPDGGEIRMELIDGIDVMFGNPNDCFTEHQPYILLVGRDTVQHLQQEAAYYSRISSNSPPSGNDSHNPPVSAPVRPDYEFQDFPGIGGHTELYSSSPDSGKALYVLLYVRHGSSIHVTKATRDTVIYEDIDTGLNHYPLAWGNWEKQKNQYHGHALITELVPNQIFINTMFAAAVRHLQLAAFPKVIYNMDIIPRWTNQPGDAIGVHNPYGEDVAKAVHSVRPADMSEQIFNMIDRAIDYIKECSGATEVQLGSASAQNTSALRLLKNNAETSLVSIRVGMYEWVEACAAILLDMMETYQPERLYGYGNASSGGYQTAGMPSGFSGVSAERVSSGNGVSFSGTPSGMKLWQTFDIEAESGESVHFSAELVQQLLDELRKDGAISAAQYIERLPDNAIPRKRELLDELKKMDERKNHDGHDAPSTQNDFHDAQSAQDDTPVVTDV